MAQPSYHNSENLFGAQPFPEEVYGSVPVYVQENDPEVVHDDQPANPEVSFETNQQFESRNELVSWVFLRGLENGYVITTRRSNKKGDIVVAIWLQCDRGGEHKTTATVRHAGSKKINCPFKLIGRYNKEHDVWMLYVENGEHNHPPGQYMEGHSYARRLTPEQFKKVEQMHALNIPPRKIIAALKEEYKDNLSVSKDIHNAVQKIRTHQRVNETPMQTLEKLLSSRDYVYYTRDDPVTRIVGEIFFVHSLSYKMWRAFPHVLLIDPTYKTNYNRMPFVQIVGVTSTGKSFCVACAFVCNEREETFVWVLQMLKNMLQKNMEPRAIVTDRDIALMNACAKIFPNATRSLCRFHIQQNILKNSKGAFKENEDWAKFVRLWTALCESTTQEVYDFNYDKLFRLLQTNKQKSKYY